MSSPPWPRPSGVADVPAPAAGFERLYDEHPEYAARRVDGSFEQQQVDIEVRAFKLPQLLACWPGPPPGSVLEIGCATGELIAAWPVAPGGRRVGLDLSSRNVEAARRRFPGVAFDSADFRLTPPRGPFDLVVLSDVLEHVEDDAGFLHDAAALASQVLVNLPLECNWLNARRQYGVDDVSGHLRRYTPAQGLALFTRAGLEVQGWHRAWLHETAAEDQRRALRRRRDGRAFAGGPLGAAARALAFGAAKLLPPFGRRLLASNLFVLARSAEAGRR